MRVAVLDMGSTSFHLLVADVAHGDVSEVHRNRAYLELGMVMGRDGEFSDDVMEGAVATAIGFHREAVGAGAETFSALATSAIRDARNGAELAGRLAADTPWPVRVIDGDEEARLVFLGQRAALRQEGILGLAIDLGGGSLELAVASDGEAATTASLPLGVGRLMTTLGPADPPDPGELTGLAEAVRDALAPYRPPGPAAGTIAGISGGSVRALARVVGGADAPVGGRRLSRASVTSWAERLSRMGRARRSRLPGAGQRGETLHVAAIVVAATLESLGREEVVVSEWGMREGALLEQAEEVDDSSPGRREEMARWVHGRAGDVAHGRHVAAVASWLFELTRAHHALGPAELEALQLAALAHAAACTGVHDDGRRVAAVLEQAALRTLPPEQLDLVRAVLRRAPRAGVDGPSARRRRDVRVLAALLHVADALDADRSRPVRRLHLVDGKDGLRLLADGTGDVRGACVAARRRLRPLEELLGRPMVVLPASA